jgi:hypothetical protein
MNDPLNNWEEDFDNLLADAMLAYYNGRTSMVESNEEFRQASDALHDFVRKLADTRRGVPDGWKLMPTYANEDIRAVIRNENDVYQNEDALYQALLSAATSPEKQ